MNSNRLPATAYALGAAPAPALGRLQGDVKADVLVIGAGYAGLSAALHAAEQGMSVAVLEAFEVGYGASGRNFGQVVPYLRHSGEHALDKLGEMWGSRLIESAAEGAELVFSLIERYKMRCDPKRGGLMFAAHDWNHVSVLENRAAFWKRRGVELRILDASETAAKVGGGHFPASIIEPRGGTINALSFARELAGTMMSRGAKLFIDSPLETVDREDRQWIARTKSGSVTAKWVLMCTGAYTDKRFRSLSRVFLPIRAYQFETQPLPPDIRTRVLPEITALTDTRPMISGIRIYEDGRLHLSSDGAPFTPADRQNDDFAIKRLKEIFPFIRDIRIRSQWSGLIDFVPDQFPRIVELGQQFLAPIGFSGRGIALATMIGKELAGYAATGSCSELRFMCEHPSPIPSKLVAQFAVGVGMTYFRLADRIAGWKRKSKY